uniref:Reverse transcriptase domain-containing protein n=1 Tax=Cannabis sativa TaxID=3483 RepID=A0A803QQH2_CANSA
MIMHFLSSVQYQVLLNGGLTKAFAPKRGLRQGDPLSPYVFILGAEVLSRFFSKAESEGNLRGYSLNREGIPISHLMYADDLLLYLEADRGNRSSDFNFILDEISARLEGWRARLLSQAARGTLIKSVLASIPIYSMWARDVNFSLIAKIGWLLEKDSKAFLTHDFIRQNCVWVVGQDSDVKIWFHKWSCGNHLVVYSGAINPLVGSSMGIQELVDLAEDGWHQGRVVSTFTPAISSNIPKVKRELLPANDTAYWNSSLNGEFSSKAAYWSLNKERFEEKDVLSIKIWKLKAQKCLKLFLWKLCHDVLPFGSKLQNIFGNAPGVCMLCGQDEGDNVSHFVSLCPVTRFLWFSTRWGIRSEALQSSNGREVVNWLLSPPFHNALAQTEALEFTLYGAMLYYKLWNHRNDMYHHGVPLDLDKLARQIRELASKSIKLAASDDLQEVGAVAAVFFDDAGNLVCFGAKKVQVLLAFQGELEALAFGVALAKDLQLGGVDFSTDFLQLVQALNVGSSPVWFLMLSFNEFHHALVANDSNVVWISRVFNKAAHSLERWGLSHPCNGLLRFWETLKLRFLLATPIEIYYEMGGGSGQLGEKVDFQASTGYTWSKFKINQGRSEASAAAQGKNQQIVRLEKDKATIQEDVIGEAKTINFLGNKSAAKKEIDLDFLNWGHKLSIQ